LILDQQQHGERLIVGTRAKKSRHINDIDMAANELTTLTANKVCQSRESLSQAGELRKHGTST
jgi:hypothetical protein